MLYLNLIDLGTRVLNFENICHCEATEIEDTETQQRDPNGAVIQFTDGSELELIGPEAATFWEAVDDMVAAKRQHLAFMAAQAQLAPTTAAVDAEVFE